MRSHGLARHKLRATLTPKKNSLSDDFDKMDKYLCPSLEQWLITCNVQQVHLSSCIEYYAKTV